MRLPDFCIAGYEQLLVDLQAAAYELCPVEAMRSPPPGRVAFVRHDVDLHIPGIERIAEIERAHGVNATYYIPLTLHFNPAYPENRGILRRLVDEGHNIGLHYDLTTYPAEEDMAWAQLDREVQALSLLVGAPVESICMHFPWGGREDIFRCSRRYVHPHSPELARDVVYVSDSCRAWRDETLLGCFEEDAPQRILLNTHPELWLSDRAVPRYEFAEGAMLEHTVAQHRRYVIDYMLPAWRVHPAPRLHDAREARTSGVIGG